MTDKNVPRVEQYMTRMPYTIDPRATLAEAHHIMREHDIRHLPVVEDGELVGMVSVRDLHLLETLQGIDENIVPVEDAMTEKPYTVAPNEPIDHIAAVMASKKIGSAVVFDGREIVGIFTTTDALVALLHIWKQRA